MAKNKSQYDSTLNLPKTLFEMRAGLPKKEPVMLKDWDDNDLYNQLMKHNEGKPQFILHDGPPYANGNIHMGTALNKIIKDIIIREKNMEGYQAPYVPGFDTHGLPIELKALSSVGDKKKDISKLELRQICEKFATEHIDIMSDQFKRLGVIGDFEHPDDLLPAGRVFGNDPVCRFVTFHPPQAEKRPQGIPHGKEAAGNCFDQRGKKKKAEKKIK